MFFTVFDNWSQNQTEDISTSNTKQLITKTHGRGVKFIAIKSIPSNKSPAQTERQMLIPIHKSCFDEKINFSVKKVPCIISGFSLFWLPNSYSSFSDCRLSINRRVWPVITISDHNIHNMHNNYKKHYIIRVKCIFHVVF